MTPETSNTEISITIDNVSTYPFARYVPNCLGDTFFVDDNSTRRPTVSTYRLPMWAEKWVRINNYETSDLIFRHSLQESIDTCLAIIKSIMRTGFLVVIGEEYDNNITLSIQTKNKTAHDQIKLLMDINRTITSQISSEALSFINIII